MKKTKKQKIVQSICTRLQDKFYITSLGGGYIVATNKKTDRKFFLNIYNIKDINDLLILCS